MADTSVLAPSAAETPTASQAAAEKMKADLAFAQRNLLAAKTLEDFVTAAQLAVDIADKAAELAQKLHPKAGPEAHLGNDSESVIALTVTGLPAHDSWTWARAKRFFCQELKLQVAHVDKQTKKPFAVLRFYDKAAREAAKQALQGVTIQDQTLEWTEGESSEAASARQAGRGAKRGAEGQEGEGGPRKRPYQEQLRDKYNSVLAALTEVTRQVDRKMFKRKEKTPWLATAQVDAADVKTDPAAPVKTEPGAVKTEPETVKIEPGAVKTEPEAMKTEPGAVKTEPDASASAQATDGGAASKAARSGPVFLPAAPLLGVIRAPQIEGYRNKSEFTCGHDAKGDVCTGFLLGNMADGISAVGDVSETRHTSHTARSYAAAMTTFLKTATTLPPWNKRVMPCDGFWRTLTVREGHSSRTFLPLARNRLETAPETQTFEGLDPYPYLVTVESNMNDPRVQPLLSALPVTPLPLSEVQEQEAPSTQPDQVMLIVQVNPRYTAVADNLDLMRKELAGLAKFMRAHAAEQGLALTHILVQQHWDVSNAAPVDAPLSQCPEDTHTQPADTDGTVASNAIETASYGPVDAHITDTLCDLRFRVSPTAFFQVNTPAACLLYRMASEWAAPHPNVTLFDVCCGTGTIGLTTARRVNKVIGVDSVPSAIRDARANAALNHVTNAEFHCAKAEECMEELLAKHATEGTELVAIVDPPRSGLHKRVIQALLKCAALKRIVYISCKPASMTDNLKTLCTPPDGQQWRGKGPQRRAPQAQQADADVVPFTPVKAVAVDLFPHTAHVETLVLLERN